MQLPIQAAFFDTLTEKNKQEMILFSCVRLNRCLADHTFPWRAETEENMMARDKMESALKRLKSSKKNNKLEICCVGEISRRQKLAHIEQSFFNETFAANPLNLFAFDINQSFFCLLNDEDHLKLEIKKFGSDFNQYWQSLSKIDTKLEEKLGFAFSLDIGYVNSSLASCGTGLELSSIVHIPALKRLAMTEKALSPFKEYGCFTAPCFIPEKEKTEAFVIKFRGEKGEKEQEILLTFEYLLSRLREQEAAAREKLADGAPFVLEDQICRSWAILNHSRRISYEEALIHLFNIRLGINLNILENVNLKIVDYLMLSLSNNSVSCNLNNSVENESWTEETALIRRAEYLRKILNAGPDLFNSQFLGN